MDFLKGYLMFCAVLSVINILGISETMAIFNDKYNQPKVTKGWWFAWPKIIIQMVVVAIIPLFNVVFSGMMLFGDKHEAVKKIALKNNCTLKDKGK